MVAGRGITHSEREREEIWFSNHKLHGLQLWHVLPESNEDMDPAFYHYTAKNLPYFSGAAVEMRLLIGTACGVTPPVKTIADTLNLEAHVTTGQTFQLPQCELIAVYLTSGSKARLPNSRAVLAAASAAWILPRCA